MERVDRPIFIIGTGRCGLSLVVELVAQHQDLAWFSQWTDHFPRSRFAPRAPRVLNFPVVRQAVRAAEVVTRRRLRPYPDESFRAFEVSFRGFGRPYRPLTPLDLDQNARHGIHRTVLAHINGQRKKRFVTDLSGWARIRFLREIFPDAQFVHVVRDARPTVNSLLNVDWWHGWYGETQWRWGRMPDKYRPFVENGTPSFAALAGVHYNILIDNILSESETLEAGSFLEIRFEDFVRKTEESLRRVCAFCDLEWTPAFARAWQSVRVFDPNNKKMRIAPWRENLSDEQKDIITRVCGEHLRRYRYLCEE